MDGQRYRICYCPAGYGRICYCRLWPSTMTFRIYAQGSLLIPTQPSTTVSPDDHVRIFHSDCNARYLVGYGFAPASPVRDRYVGGLPSRMVVTALWRVYLTCLSSFRPLIGPSFAIKLDSTAARDFRNRYQVWNLLPLKCLACPCSSPDWRPPLCR
jgi:hypothetical protein